MKAKLVKENLNDYTKLYGGKNKKNPPFNIGDKLQQIWRIDDKGAFVKDGREIVEFIGMQGDMMLLKTLNIHSAYGEDTISPDVIKMSKQKGYSPIIGDILKLHYMYADRFKVVDLKEGIQVPFSNKNRNAPISGSYPLSRLQYEDADKKKIGFTEESDPIEDMGIGLTTEQLILNILIEKHGDTIILHKFTPEELKNKPSWERHGKYNLNRNIPMSVNDWKELKTEIGGRKLSRKYTEVETDVYYGVKIKVRNFNYLKLFEDVYGQEWYHDGVSLVQGSRTIVYIKSEMTFKEMVEEIEKSPGLQRKSKR